MTGFLGHLAAMALGTKSAVAARVSLPSRLSSLSPVPAVVQQGFGPVEATEPTTRVTPDWPVSQREPALPVALPVAARGAEQRASEEAPARIPPEPMETYAHPAAHPALLTSTGPLPALPLADSEQTTRRPGVGISSPVVDKLAVVPSAPPSISLPVPPRTPRAAAPQRPLERAALQRPAVRTAPLSDAAVAGRALPPRVEAPVIHVTIDRLDVRAAVPAKVAVPQRRPRADPTVSLSDYLRNGARAGRG